jgi:hypothetical protein
MFVSISIHLPTTRLTGTKILLLMMIKEERKERGEGDIGMNKSESENISKVWRFSYSKQDEKEL